MKELRKKTFWTIFSILMIILLFSVFFVNIQNYRREYENIERTLTVFDGPGNLKGGVRFPEEKENGWKDQDRSEPEKMMIMDYEVYTVELRDDRISRIISHGNASDDFDVEQIANKIIEDNEKQGLYIQNLYLEKYVYSYRPSVRIVIINNESIASDMRLFLIVSIMFLILLGTVIYLISKKITEWISLPVEEAFKKQKEFIADASHEVKTPLAVIMASSDELSQADILKTPEYEGYLENIRYESDRMSRLINGLLRLSKLDEAITKDAFREEDLSDIAQKTCLAFEAVAFEESVMIRTDIDKNIMFDCSKDEIEQMLSTILDNAIKHSYADSEVNVSLKKASKNIIINITNTGDPIASGDEERIFERFYRADKSRNRQSNRYGLGLAIAKSIVIRHGGSIRAYSKDLLTTFEIVF